MRSHVPAAALLLGLVVTPLMARSQDGGPGVEIVHVELRDEVAEVAAPGTLRLYTTVSRDRRDRPFDLVVRDQGGRVLETTTFAFPLARTVPPAPSGVVDGAPIALVPIANPSAELRLPMFPDVRSLEIVPAPERDARAPRRRAADDRLDVALLASGFSAARMGQFRLIAGRVQSALLAEAPFAPRAGRIRVRLHENLAPLGCDRGCNAIDRLICCDDRAVIAAAGDVDEIIVIHDTHYGGSGYQDGGTGFQTNSYSTYAVTYGADDEYQAQVQVALHEFGHSFGNLCDEYSYGTEAVPHVVCVNCRADCDWSSLESACTQGCGARPAHRRPSPSLMLDSGLRGFNTASISAAYAPFGLRARLEYFVDGALPP